MARARNLFLHPSARHRWDRSGEASLDESTFAPWEQPADKRRFRRWLVEMPAYLEVDARFYYVILTDIAPTGARARLLEARLFADDAEAALDLEGFGRIPAEVRHGVAGVLGLRFLLDDDRQRQLADWLIAAHLQRRQKRHLCHVEAAVAVRNEEIPCVVTDLSRNGAGIRLRDKSVLTFSSEVQLLLPNHRPITAIIRHLSDERVGLMFVDGFEGELPSSDFPSER